jgi:hypothetical protein
LVATTGWRSRRGSNGPGCRLSGGAAGQIERHLHDELDVQAANREADEAAVSSAHRGTFTPQRCRTRFDEWSFGWFLAAGFALLLVPAARSGMVPEPQIGVWTARFLVAAMVFGAVPVVRKDRKV